MSKSTHIPWLDFFHQQDWYQDLFIKYGGLQHTFAASVFLFFLFFEFHFVDFLFF